MLRNKRAEQGELHRDHGKAIEIIHYTHVFHTTYNRRRGFVATARGPKAAGKNSGHKIGGDQKSRRNRLKLISTLGASSFIVVDHLQKPKSFFMELTMYP